MSKFPPAGTEAFLISNKWISKYKKYIFFKKLKRN
jgi:hypothetical protein